MASVSSLSHTSFPPLPAGQGPFSSAGAQSQQALGNAAAASRSGHFQGASLSLSRSNAPSNQTSSSNILVGSTSSNSNVGGLGNTAIGSSNINTGSNGNNGGSNVRLYSTLNASTAGALVNHLKSGSKIRLRVIKGGATNRGSSLLDGGNRAGGNRSQNYLENSDSSSRSFRDSGSFEAFPFASGMVTNNDGSLEDITERDVGPIPVETRVPMMAVLEDMLDQLSILENISPPSARSAEKKSEMQAGSELQSGRRIFKEFMSQNGLNSIAANEQKLESERRSLKSLMETTEKELEEGYYGTLINYVQQEYSTRGQLEETILREREASETLKQLNRELDHERRTFDDDLNNRNQVIQELKDTIHEIHSLTSAEQKYLKKETRAHETSLRQQCSSKENAQTEEKNLLIMQIRQEEKVHEKITSFLNQQREGLERQIQDWMLRYEEDTESKASELEAIKQNRSADMDRFEELAAKYEELEKLVDEDRKSKAREIEQARIRAIQDGAATRIQAWWRGCHFRRVELGSLLAKKGPKASSRRKSESKKPDSAKSTKSKKGDAGGKGEKKKGASPKKKK